MNLNERLRVLNEMCSGNQELLCLHYRILEALRCQHDVKLNNKEKKELVKYWKGNKTFREEIIIKYYVFGIKVPYDSWRKVPYLIK